MPKFIWRRPSAFMTLLALTVLPVGCNTDSTGTCGDSFKVTDKDQPANVDGLFKSRDPSFVNGTYNLSFGNCSELSNQISLTLSSDGNSVTLIDGANTLNGDWSETAQAFSLSLSGKQCFLSTLKDTVHCIKSANVLCPDAPSCQNGYTGQ